MKAYYGNTKDVQKYYGGTYVIIPEISTQHVMLLKEASTKGIVCQDSRDNSYGLISFEDGFEYELQSPLATRKAWFMHEGNAYLISRIPARMWKKGISSENTQIARLTSTNDFAGVSINPKILNAFLQATANPQLPKPKEMVTLSPEWAFNGHSNNLFLWDTVIGKYARRTNELFVPRELQELCLPEITKSMKVKYV